MKEKKESIHPVTDREQMNAKRYSDGAENFVRGGLDALEDLFGKLLEVRPKEYKPKEFHFKTREFKPREFDFVKKENKKGSEDD